MNIFFEELKKYFEVTPQEKILEDWAKSAEFDKIGSTVEEFLLNTKTFFNIHTEDPPMGILIESIKYSPKYSSVFFKTKILILMQKAVFSITNYQFDKVIIDLSNHKSNDLSLSFDTIISDLYNFKKKVIFA
jgi:hypothetical protein